ERLALALGLGQRAGGDDRAAGGEPLHLGFVVGQGGRSHHLDRGEAGAVADVDETQPCLGVAPGAHPAADRDFPADGQLARERMFDADRCHAACNPEGEPQVYCGRGKRRDPRPIMTPWPSNSLPPRWNASVVTWPRTRRPWACASACAAPAAPAGATWPSWPANRARTTRCSSRMASGSTWTPTAWPWSTGPGSTSSSPG